MLLLATLLFGTLLGALVALWQLGVRIERRPRDLDTVYQVVLPGQVLASFTRRK